MEIGPMTINNAKVLALNSNKNAIIEYTVSSSEILIEGNSIIANGAINVEGIAASAIISMKRFWKFDIERKYYCYRRILWW